MEMLLVDLRGKLVAARTLLAEIREDVENARYVRFDMDYDDAMDVLKGIKMTADAGVGDLDYCIKDMNPFFGLEPPELDFDGFDLDAGDDPESVEEEIFEFDLGVDEAA
jgi:hypothetical protein